MCGGGWGWVGASIAHAIFFRRVKNRSSVASSYHAVQLLEWFTRTSQGRSDGTAPQAQGAVLSKSGCEGTSGAADARTMTP